MIDAGRWDRRDTGWVAAVVGVALLLRVVYLLQLTHSPYFAHEVMDAAVHDTWAREIAAGRPWAEGPYFRAPLYLWFLGLLYRLTGADLFAVRLVQGLIGTASCALVYAVGRRAFGRTAAGLAGLACAAYWLLLFFDHELLVPVLAIALDLAMLYALMRLARGGGLAWSAVAGVLLGLSALARPNVLLFAPPAAAWMLLWPRLPRPGWRPAALLAAGSLLIVLPVTARNLVVGHDLVLVSSHAGLNLWIGNNPQADGLHVLVPGLDLTVEDVYEGSARAAERDVGHALKPSAVSSYYAAHARRWIATHPGDALALTLSKAAAFWSSAEIVNNKHFAVLTRRYTPVAWWSPVGFWLVGPLGLAGIVACRKRAWESFPLWGFVLAYMASVVPFFVTARFRLPVVPVLALLAAHGGLELVRLVRARDWSGAAPPAVALVVGVLLAGHVPPGSHVSDAAALEKLGAALVLQGRPEDAVALLQEAVASDPALPGPRVTLARLYDDLGEDDRAADAYADAIAAVPSDLDLLARGAEVATRAGHHAQAAAWLGRLLAAEPDRRDAWIELAMLLAGSPDDAVRDCAGAKRAADNALAGTGRRDARAWDALAAARSTCGDMNGAVEAASTAMRLARESGNAALAARIGERYREYVVGRPFRLD